MSSQMVARYFNRVLGVQTVPFVVPITNALQEVASAASKIVLLDVREGEVSPSLEQMGARLLEAIRAEWIKRSVDRLPKFEWMRSSQADWLAAVIDQGPAKLVIVCGAGDVHQTPANVLHVPSLIEMQASPVVKRDAWRAMQKSLGELQ
jgi:hypothetical protein